MLLSDYIPKSAVFVVETTGAETVSSKRLLRGLCVCGHGVFCGRADAFTVVRADEASRIRVNGMPRIVRPLDLRGWSAAHSRVESISRRSLMQCYQ